MTKDTFNWITALEAAVRTEPSDSEHSDLALEASYWPTCACGQLCKRLPRRYPDSSEPYDKELGKLGRMFSNLVQLRNWPAALAIFHQIEARTQTLLKEQESAPGNLDSRNQ